MGQVYDISAEIISEQSKKEICEAVIFYSVADKYIFGAKKKEKCKKTACTLQTVSV